MVSPALGGLAIKMIIDLGVQNTFGRRLLQFVQQAVLTVRIKIDLPFEPGLTASQDIGAILLGRVRGLFLRVIL